MEFSSKLIEEAVNTISKLPGIGKKSAFRLVLHLLKQPEGYALGLSNVLKKLRMEIEYCPTCHNVSDGGVCTICSNKNRDASLLCLVENMQDVVAIECTAQFRGRYHVLGQLISPLDGIGPDKIPIDTLIHRIQKDGVKEVIFALRATVEGDTTAFYVSKKLKDMGIKTSMIARGVAVGCELEYTDEVTLGRSIVERVGY